MAALRDSGGLKAGMPLEIASVPVIAVQPEAKARRTRNQVSASVDATGDGAAGGSVPVSSRIGPDGDEQAEAHDEDVGRHREDPARLPHAAQVRQRDHRHAQTTPSATLCVAELGEGRGDRRHPGATDTETVRT